MKNRLIFIVDDDRLIQNLLEYTIIGKEGYDVKAYKSSEECIRNLDQKPDVIVLDHNFYSEDESLMNGLEALVEIRKIDKTVPVIILTNQEDEKLIQEYYDKGATSYIIKNDYFISTVIDRCEQVLQSAKC